MAQKIYRNLICQDYGITLNVKGVNVHINFSGGKRFPVRTNGVYITDNSDIIEALENHHLYGKDWKLESFIPEPTQMKVSDPIPVTLDDSPVETRILKSTVTTDSANIVLEPRNVQQAKEWLNKNKGVPYNKLKNREDVFSVAKEHNIDFANIIKT